MPNHSHDVKPGPLPPELTRATGPGAYAKWRATTLGTVTAALEQRRILALVGSVEGKRVLDLGCGDGLLTATLATHGARVVGIDIDRSALHSAVARVDTTRAGSVRFVVGRIECLPFPAEAFDVVTAVTVLCLVTDRSSSVRNRSSRAACGPQKTEPYKLTRAAMGSRKYHFQTLHYRFNLLVRRRSAQAESDRAHAALWRHVHRLQDGR